jgi:glycosyltransferase involved in cell wall biosynthesis
MSKPLISVVVPTYNRARLIQPTLDAILAQSRPADEIIVIDDGSTDDTEAQLAKYRDRIFYRRIDNSGVQTARNTGISLARGDWIALCDSDDIWLPQYLDRQARFVAAQPNLDFSFANFRTMKNGIPGNVTKFDEAAHERWKPYIAREIPEGWILTKDFVGWSFAFFPIFPSAMMFTKALFDAVGGFDPSLRAFLNEDGIFTTKCLFHAQAGAIPEPLVTIRKHEKNLSGNQLMLTVDEVNSLILFRDTVPEARPYRDILEAEIWRRSIGAAQGAFACQEHALMRTMLKNVPFRKRPPKVHFKHLVGLFPDAVALPINGLLQRTAEWMR